MVPRRQGSLRMEALPWALLAVGLCIAFLVFMARGTDRSAASGGTALAALSIAAIQSLYLCYAAAFPARGAAEIAAASAPHISDRTQLYFVGQYRQSLTWYLRREIPFTITSENSNSACNNRTSKNRWIARTSCSTGSKTRMRWPTSIRALIRRCWRRGMPGHVVAHDARSILVSR